MPTGITMDDYERRFQRSLQKLTIPTWYADTSPSSKISIGSKQSIISTPAIPWKRHCRESERTPEIIHVRRPQSYRSCRSSLATSPSPSMHSWHPNHLIDGVNFALLLPSTSSRRSNKYQKGIERVSKSTRWYQPTQFITNEQTKNQIGISRVSTNHYDTPKIHLTSSCLVTPGDRAETIVHEQNNNMKEDNHIKSNESQTMPLVKLEEPFHQIELEEDDKRIDQEQLLERAANDLVQSVLADILLLRSLDDDDDRNSGVRELSEDENGLRELDEDEINDTDEFIVFASQSERDDDLPRFNLNRLYTFSKINEEKNSTRSIIENDFERTYEQSFFPRQCSNQAIHFDQFRDDGRLCPALAHQSSEGVNEETARIGRMLLDSMPIENIHHLSRTPNSARLRSKMDEYDYEFHGQVRRDSAYSSNQERIHLQQSIYEPLSECYSGYSFVQSDFLSPNLSSIQSTTDEAYESEPTTMCSSIATTAHVHPDLEHEFEFPSPPPPVPDRRLKPVHLKVLPPPTKSRSSKQNLLNSNGYSIIEKTKPLPITTIQEFLQSVSNDSTAASTRMMSSRHYCGTIPVANEETTQSSINSKPIRTKEHSTDKTKDKRSSRTTLNCLHPNTSDEPQKRNVMNKTKTKKAKVMTDFDEVTNGLAIRLPAPISTMTNKSTPNRTSTPLSTKQVNGMTRNRTTFYETSV